MTVEAPQPQPEPTPELVIPDYELTASRRGLIKTNGVLQEHEGRFNNLPEQPENFHAITGTYYDVAKEATRRNNIQMDSGFLDYLFAPEPRKLAAA